MRIARDLPTLRAELASLGVRRINVSLDTLDPQKFRAITRRGDLPVVLDGIAAARAAGMKVKINAVALRDVNADEIPDMIAWAHGLGMDMTLIEVMPLGEIEADRTDQFLPLSVARQRLESRYTLTPLPDRTGGPARYFDVAETGTRVGFFTPMTHNFCESCNRVRLTCTGTLFMCLGQDDASDLRAVMRGGASDAELDAATAHRIDLSDADGQLPRPAKRHRRDQRAETDRGGLTGDAGECHPRVGRPGQTGNRPHLQVVVGTEERVVPGVLRGLGHAQQVVVGGPLLRFGEDPQLELLVHTPSV